MARRRDDRYRNYDRSRTRKYNTKSSRPSHVTIVPRENDSIEKTIKKFIRKTKKSGIIEEFRKRLYFEKPSSVNRKRRLRSKAARTKETKK